MISSLIGTSPFLFELRPALQVLLSSYSCSESWRLSKCFLDVCGKWSCVQGVYSDQYQFDHRLQLATSSTYTRSTSRRLRCENSKLCFMLLPVRLKVLSITKPVSEIHSPKQECRPYQIRRVFMALVFPRPILLLC